MKFIIILLSSLIILTPAQQGVPYVKLDAAFDQKNAESIVAMAKDKVMVNILGKEGAYSRQQAILVLKDFFNGKNTGTFNFTFKGNESENGTFAIGHFIHGTTKYRVTMHFKLVTDGYRIESITIEKD